MTSLEERLLRSSRVVAVLGAHREPHRAAFYVPAYLREHGYDIWPVNPAFTGVELHGRLTRATLAEISTHASGAKEAIAVDLVDVFRRSEHLPAHVDDILAMSPLPKAVWLQLGITNDAVARVLHSHGIEVVQDRCTLAEHRRLGLA